MPRRVMQRMRQRRSTIAISVLSAYREDSPPQPVRRRGEGGQVIDADGNEQR